MTARERLGLAAAVARDAAGRLLYGRYTGTPPEHADRWDELLGRKRDKAAAPGPVPGGG